MPHRQSRVVLISGASSGIGRALAVTFAAHGDRVVALARSRAALASLRRSIGRSGGTCISLSCDVRKLRAVREAAQKARRLAGVPHIVIHNAGITVFKSFLRTSQEEFDDILQTNLMGTVLLTRQVLPWMIRRKSGMIVNILSMAAKVVYTGSAAYSASKAAGSALMNVIREEVRKKGIRVVNIYPGAVLTGMWNTGVRRKYANRMMRAEEVAELVYAATIADTRTSLEEMVLRPRQGDLRI